MAAHLKGRMTDHYFIGLWHTARDAACRAARAEHENPGADRRRGFAWVNLPKRSKFTEWARKQGITSTQPSNRGLRRRGVYRHLIWYGQLHDVKTPSIGVHTAACKAASRVLANGMNVRVTIGSKFSLEEQARIRGGRGR